MSATIHMLWVGQGDCSVIVTQTNKVIMIDCGTSNDHDIYNFNVKPMLEKILKDAGDKKEIDLLILTHSDLDHCCLVKKVISDLGVKFLSVCFGGSESQYKLSGINLSDASVFLKKEVLVSHFRKLDYQVLEDGNFSILIICANYPYSYSPGGAVFSGDINTKKKTKLERSIFDNNGNSVVAIVRYAGFNMAFLGDATPTEQFYLYEGIAASTPSDFEMKCLKLSHHGSPESYEPNLTLNVFKPKSIFASAGNKFGHPSQDMVIDKITTVVDGANSHDYVAYDTENEVYEEYDATDFIYNTNVSYKTVTKEVKVASKSNDKKITTRKVVIGTILSGSNYTITVSDAGVPTISGQTAPSIATSTGIENVTARKRRHKHY